jgi:hypothetical protein
MKILLFIPSLLVLAFLILLRAPAKEEKPLRLAQTSRCQQWKEVLIIWPWTSPVIGFFRRRSVITHLR